LLEAGQRLERDCPPVRPHEPQGAPHLGALEKKGFFFKFQISQLLILIEIDTFRNVTKNYDFFPILMQLLLSNTPVFNEIIL